MSKDNAVVHVIGTGTIGEPLIGLLAAFKEPLALQRSRFTNAPHC